MKFLNPLITLLLISCSLSSKIENQNLIQFSKKEIGREINYYMTAPILAGKIPTLIRIFGGHGKGFEYSYIDGEKLYFSNDNCSGKPNDSNYESINWPGYSRFCEIDTTLTGKQGDGRYWREIKKGRDYIGYLNVSKSDTASFNKALKSFKF